MSLRPVAGLKGALSSASRAASPDRSDRLVQAASWLPYQRPLISARRFVLDVQRQRPVRVRLHAGDHRRVDEIAIDWVSISNCVFPSHIVTDQKAFTGGC
jgi:hypothetical protein